MRFTTDEVAAATGGEIFGRPTEVERVSIDSRAVQPGDLFVPIVADRDGHDFIAAATKAGAAAYLTSGPIEGATSVLVADTAVALTALGSYARSRLTGQVVGVTGSVGKTSLKDLLAWVAATTWRTTVSIGSFNNELGVPLTLANAPDDSEVVVVEMGARGIGHVAELCRTARPTVGVITRVAGAHLETFGSLEGIADAKSELVVALPSTGTAVLNMDDHRVAAMARRTEASVVGYGLDAGDVRAEGVTVDDHLRARFTLRSPWGSAEVHLGVAGRHQVSNALGAAATALALGAEVEAVAAGLGAARLSAMRMDVRVLPNGLRVIDDTYNANPTSMAAALQSLGETRANRRFAVLGTMAELGDGADDAHRHVAEAAHAAGVIVVSVAEPRYGSSVDVAVDDPEAAVDWLRSQSLTGDDAVLVKASRSARLERVVAGLTDGQ